MIALFFLMDMFSGARNGVIDMWLEINSIAWNWK